MTHKHNFIFKTVTCLIMASAIFVLTSFVLPDTNVVEAKQLSCISYENSRCLRIGFIIFIRMNTCLDPAF